MATTGSPVGTHAELARSQIKEHAETERGEQVHCDRRLSEAGEKTGEGQVQRQAGGIRRDEAEFSAVASGREAERREQVGREFVEGESGWSEEGSGQLTRAEQLCAIEIPGGIRAAGVRADVPEQKQQVGNRGRNQEAFHARGEVHVTAKCPARRRRT